jgi:vacuolar-type H+-ATPase subunit I/STV1
MRFIGAAIVVLVVLATVNVVTAESEQYLPNAANLGYVPESVPFDNPATLSEPVATIPSYPDCTVRPQTIVEIKKMRENAARIAQMIQTETFIMQKRKTYIEQMTSYINDRIRELNKVKGELEQETRWVQISSERINELAEKEKLIKMQDILSCLNQDSNRLQGEKQTQQSAISKLQSQATAIEASISKIKSKIDTAEQSGASPAVAGSAGEASDPAAAAAAAGEATDPAAAAAAAAAAAGGVAGAGGAGRF